MNYKQDLLDIVKEQNLQILKIDCKFSGFSTYRGTINTLDQLDFDSSTGYDIFGIIYCRHAISKQPIWLIRVNGSKSSWWQLNKVPDFYKTLKY